MVSVGEALNEVAGYRRYSLLCFCILSVTMMTSLACQGLNIVFIGFKPPHHCKVPERKRVNESIPLDKYGQLEKCVMYDNDTQGNATTSCTDGWTYTRADNEETIVTEWDLVCGHNHLAGLSHTIYQVGAVAGMILLSRLVDVVGRKWLGIVSNIIIAILGTGLAHMPTFVSFICLRTIIAFFEPIILVSGATLVMEICGTKQREFYGIINLFGWSLIYFYVGIVAYFIRAWRTLQLILSLTSLIGLLAIIVPESPYWLVSNERVDEAEGIVQKIARYNRIRVPGCMLSGTKDELLKGHDENPDTKNVHVNDEWSTKYKGPGEETIQDMFTDRTLLKYLLVSLCQWFVVSLVYYMGILGSYIFGGDLYLNFTLGGVVELPAYVASYFIANLYTELKSVSRIDNRAGAKKGRNLPIGIFFIIIGAVMAALGFTPATTASGMDLTPLIVVELLVLRIASTIPWAIMVLYVKELFPTNLRGTAFGLSSVVARIGSMVVPFALLAVSDSPLAWLPNLVIGVLAVLVGIATLTLLPETKDWPLPQSIADIHRYAEKKPHHPISKADLAEAEVIL